MRLIASSIVLFFAVTGFSAYSQVQPLSRSDSGAIQAYQQKYQEELNINRVKEASRYLNEIAFLYWNHNYYQQAADYYERSLVLNSSIDNENGIAMIHNNLGMLYADLGKYEESLASFSKTLAARRANDEKHGIIAALINKSVVNNNLKDFDQSVTDLLEALDIAREMNDMAQMKSVYGMLSESYEKKGDVDKSLQYFELYKSFHEQLQRDKVDDIQEELDKESIERRLAIADAQSKELEILKNQLELREKNLALLEKDSINQSLYENLSRAEIAIKLQENEAQLKAQQAELAEERSTALESQQFYTVLTASVLILSALVIAGFLFIGFKKSKENNRILAEKNDAIEAQRLELDDANQLKNKLFSIIAHDLKSPIGSLQGFMHVIDDFEQSEDLQEAFSHLTLQLGSVSNMLENLLKWSQSQMEQLEARPEQTDVHQIVKENIDLINLTAVSKDVEIINNVKAEEMAFADPQMVQIVLRNLIQNSVKFTQAGGKVEVSAQGENGTLDIKVRDSGIGMTQDKMSELFSIQSASPSLGTNQEPGTGLGLYLCSELLKKNNGKIVVESELNKGSTFTVSLKRHD
ncbi:MAG: ATP-binding protein [Cyclobacteriaceae bacterium]